MRSKFLFLVLASCVAFALPVTNDVFRALHLAKAYQKPIAVIFTGLEWNEESKNLVENVLESKEFADEIGNACILVHLDYSESQNLSTKNMVMHHCARDEFHIETFPTVVLLNPEYKEIARTGFFPIDGREYALHLKTKLREYDTLCHASHEDFTQLYFRAKKLGCPHLTRRFLGIGLDKQPTPDLWMEEYARLVKNGEQNTEKGKKVRSHVLASNNTDLISRLTILDYQVQGEVSLLESLRSKLQREDSNGWRLELLIAEHYIKEGVLSTAIKHARKAAELAPTSSRVALIEKVKALEESASSHI